MRNIFIAFILSGLLSFSIAIECDKVPKNDELRLKKDMMCNYDKSVRPLGGTKNSTNIKVKMVLKSYDYLDWSNKINVVVWLVMSWTDDHFKWDSREYGNLKTFYEKSDEIWMPDLALYNGEMKENTCEATNCIIHSNGLVICIPPCEYKGHCAGSFVRWPYDRQNCTLTFGAWVNTGEEINFFGAKTSIDTEDSLLNHDWKLLSISLNRHPGNYSCCPNQTFPSLRYNFILERHSTIFTVFLLIPTMVLVVINIICLLVPPNGTERWILIALSFVGHILFTQQLSWTVPRNGATIPSVLVFYRDSTAIIGVLCIHTLLVRALMGFQCDVPGWLSSPMNMVKDSPAAKFIVDTRSGNMERIEEVAEDDTTILVEPKAENPKNTAKWHFIAILVDRLMLIIMTLMYFFLIILLIPERYESSTDLPTFDIASLSSQQ